MNKKMIKYIQKPDIYEPSSDKFWEDEHISKGMLEAHLNPNRDAATRNFDFVDKSVDRIAEIAPHTQYPNLLDLGCGPGIYAERFHEKGYNVVGVDFSSRSIAYAIEHAKEKNLDIKYLCKDYLSLDFNEQFDIITLIYCDFGVLSTDNRKNLLANIHRALRPNGIFIVDMFTPEEHKNKTEYKNWEYIDNGFWCDSCHAALNSFYRYDEDNTILKQTIVITESEVKCYNIWEHTFMVNEIKADFNKTGFADLKIYSDIAGAEFNEKSNTICVVAKKCR